METYKVTLTREERDELKSITKKGVHRSQKVLNALALLNCDRGEFREGRSTNEEIAKGLKISMKTRPCKKEICGGRDRSGSERTERREDL